jgi:signal transduction histidine kinase
VTIATAWKGLKEEEKTRIPPYVLYTALFGKVEAEEIEMREALIKGLIPKKTQDRLTQLLSTKARQRFIETVAKIAWDTFYEQVWRIQCEKINEWEKKEGITTKMKKKEVKKKNSEKKEKANQQKIEEERNRAKEKKNRINEEIRKTMLGLVIEGRRPFHYRL